MVFFHLDTVFDNSIYWLKNQDINTIEYKVF